MKLLEFQAKQLLAQHGIGIPNGRLVETVSDLEEIPYPAVLKAQVPVGGRGKAGAVKVAADRNQAVQIAEALFASEVKGYGIKTLLAEAVIDIKREIYICCVNDKDQNRPIFVASKQGGVDIEQLAKDAPDKIIRKTIDPLAGLMEYDIRALAARLAVPCDEGFVTLASGLWEILRNQDATLVEINPLAVTDTGLVAADAKIVLDNAAGFRRQDLWNAFKDGQKGRIVQTQSKSEQLASEYGISYVPLDGNIGIFADGAGTGMLTLDLVRDLGGRPANFCEMGGRAAAAAAAEAMQIVLSNPNVDSLLISLIGGMTRMDQVAAGIDAYLQKNDCRVPISVRMCGTKAEEGIAILAAHGIAAQADLMTVAKVAVELGTG